MTVSTPRHINDLLCLPGKKRARRAGPWAVLLFVAATAVATAQTSTPVPAATPGKTVVVQAFSGPAWVELSPAQREVLAPLASAWPSLSQSHKRKWPHVLCVDT
eukprot:Opistho-1_new@51655